MKGPDLVSLCSSMFNHGLLPRRRRRTWGRWGCRWWWRRRSGRTTGPRSCSAGDPLSATDLKLIFFFTFSKGTNNILSGLKVQEITNKKLQTDYKSYNLKMTNWFTKETISKITATKFFTNQVECGGRTPRWLVSLKSVATMTLHNLTADKIGEIRPPKWIAKLL